MKQASSADLELAIVLPLGVVANQLQKMEAELRQLNMKALGFAAQRENRTARALIGARLERINESLGAIAGLVSDIAADLEPAASDAPRAALEEERAAAPRGSGHAAGKPRRDEED